MQYLKIISLLVLVLGGALFGFVVIWWASDSPDSIWAQACLPGYLLVQWVFPLLGRGHGIFTMLFWGQILNTVIGALVGLGIYFLIFGRQKNA